MRAPGELARKAGAPGHGGAWESGRSGARGQEEKQGSRGARSAGHGAARSGTRRGPGGRADAENEWAEAGPRQGRERAGRPRGPPRRKGREETTGRSLTRRELGHSAALLSAAGGSSRR